MKNRFIARHYYTLADLLTFTETTVLNEYKLAESYDDGFKMVLRSVFGVSDDDLDTVLKSIEAANLWSMYIAPYRLNEFIVYKDNAEITSVSDAKFQEWMTRYVARLKFTFERYKTLLDIYAAQKANLLNAVKASNTIRFNDTPQNGGEFTADLYTTTFTKTESQTDVNTLMARIDEIDKAYQNVYGNWAKEFSELFMSNPEGDEIWSNMIF